MSRIGPSIRKKQSERSLTVGGWGGKERKNEKNFISGTGAGNGSCYLYHAGAQRSGGYRTER